MDNRPHNGQISKYSIIPIIQLCKKKSQEQQVRDAAEKVDGPERLGVSDADIDEVPDEQVKDVMQKSMNEGETYDNLAKALLFILANSALAAKQDAASVALAHTDIIPNKQDMMAPAPDVGVGIAPPPPSS